MDLIQSLINRGLYLQNVPTVPIEFKNLDKYADKIRFCYQQLKDCNMIIDKGLGPGKDESLAIEARKKGNYSYLKDQDFVLALKYYNESICLSPLKSENIGKCYGNRSAIYFESHRYELSLESIKLALDHNYPEKLTPKLMERQSKCLEKLGLANLPDEHEKDTSYEKLIDKESPLVELSYPASKHLPNIIEGIECVESKEFGRHVRAKRDLYPGDFVIIDKPYIKCLKQGSEYIKCNNCHQSNFLHLIPCPYCTKAMYCGEACEQMAWKCFHKYECRVIETDLNRLVIRATLVAFTLFDDFAKLKDTIDSIKKKPDTGFDSNLTEEDTFKAIYSLATNASKRSPDDIYKRSNTLAQQWHLLITHAKIRELLRTSDAEDLFLDTLLHFSQLNDINSHELSNMSRAFGQEIEMMGTFCPQMYGSGLFPIISYLNHSCAPNVIRVPSNGALVIMVFRTIKSGEQLFDSYIPGHVLSTLENRRSELRIPYYFECKCEACDKNWPLIEGLQKMGIANFNQFEIGFDKRSYDHKWAVEYFQKCKTFLKNYDHFYPSYEVWKVQSMLQISAFILYENMPLEFLLILGNLKKMFDESIDHIEPHKK